MVLKPTDASFPLAISSHAGLTQSDAGRMLGNRPMMRRGDFGGGVLYRYGVTFIFCLCPDAGGGRCSLLYIQRSGCKKNESLLLNGMVDASMAGGLRKGNRTRQIFMEAGRRVFVRDGYLNAEISEIAKEAGKSNGTFYIYFENKPALLDALIEEFYTLIDPRFPEHDDQWYDASKAEDWEMILKNMWTTFKTHSAMFQALYQASLVDEHFAEAYAKIRNRTRIDFVNLIKARQKQSFCRSLNVEYVATAMETMILYCMNEWLAKGDKSLDRRGEKKALSALTAIFGRVMSAG